MKTLIALAVVLFATATSHGKGLLLAWDASPSPGVTNYVVYSALGSNGLAPVASVGTNRLVSISALPPGVWHFAMTAMRDGLESDFSNEVIVDVPAPPANFRILTVLYSQAVTGPYTNPIGSFILEIK